MGEIPNSGILTTVLKTFENIFSGGVANLQFWANCLLGSIILIDFVYTMLFKADDKDVLKIMIQKIVFYGMFALVIGNYKAIINDVLNGFMKVGLRAGGNRININLISDPSAVAEFGIHLSQPIWNQIASFRGMAVMYNLGTILIDTIFGLLIMASFGIMGIQFFLCWLEFYIVGCLTLIFIPFGVNQTTSFLSEGAFRTIVAFGVKLMVMSFIACAAVTTMKAWQLPDECTLQQMMYTLLGSASLTFLSWEAPKLVSTLMSGSPSLSMGEAIRSAAYAAFGAHSAGKAVTNVVKGSMKSMGAVAQAIQHGYKKEGVKGAIAGASRLASANSSFGQGRQETQRRMKAHAQAMKHAGMKDRLAR